MNFCSGFCLQGEEELFERFLYRSEFTVAGFSKGAIEAIELVLNSKNRVDSLQLFSPAFFQDKDERFKRAQLLHFKKDRESYIKNFLKNVAYPSKIELDRYYREGSYDELKMLLEYRYKKEDLQKIGDRGVLIEVYVADDDIIVDANTVVEFFKDFATIYRQKRGGHTLWI